MTPFTIRYTLTRRQRLAELLPWLPAIAGSLGFGLAVVYLGSVVSWWCLLLLTLPVIFYRGLIVLAFQLAFRPGKPVEVTVDEEELTVCVAGEARQLPLDGVIQVYRAEGETDWTVLHLDGTAITLPAGSVTAEQLDYLKAFALRAARKRWAANPPE